MDYIATPDEVISCRPAFARPEGIYWELLPEEKIAAIPALQELGRATTQKGIWLLA